MSSKAIKPVFEHTITKNSKKRSHNKNEETKKKKKK